MKSMVNKLNSFLNWRNSRQITQGVKGYLRWKIDAKVFLPIINEVHENIYDELGLSNYYTNRGLPRI